MNPKERKQVEFIFYHYGKPYIYKSGQIYGINNNFICDVDISYTNYADNEEIIRICCFCALVAFEAGKTIGAKKCKEQIKEFLEV